MSPIKIGIILGSTRTRSNTQGISTYFQNILSTSYPSLEVETIHLSSSPGHPLPFQLDQAVPQAHSLSTLPDAYSDFAVRRWSSTVMEWDGLVIITPQYNWGYPSILKNAFDHLYHEWTGLPVGIVTLGGHGGTKCLEQLKIVLGGGLHVVMVQSDVLVQSPRELIVSEKRLGRDESLLGAYEEGMRRLVDEVVERIENRRKLKTEE
ncbi:hypothetical protein I204_01508 [Kwoniella mangroviensis CBS 8886]|nr:hypothetical protein I204_01508 [Kwoniella mangroviensis CBS 8886]